ncbi:predicted protein [Nematostella vectensis]|uniref:Cathepsin propeptide inhibitor domain-containing protein n=1 Tax=Nematostella vectensis TaxID=45351 RepID=A7RK92_NEMVE|nr:predicted protein [Nematostella vectensis]|eukprot:XP_001640191.1 predicted protein [Nematostella vectensis]
MAEFTSLGYSRDLVDDDFDEFRQQHDKVYEDDSEHRRRKHIFRHNVRYIRSMKRRSLPYKLEPNHFGDLTDDEFKSYKGELDDESNDVMKDRDDVIDDDVNDDTQKDEEDDPRSGYRRSGISGESHENRKNEKKELKNRTHTNRNHSKRMFEVPDQLDWLDYGKKN